MDTEEKKIMYNTHICHTSLKRIASEVCLLETAKQKLIEFSMTRPCIDETEGHQLNKYLQSLIPLISCLNEIILQHNIDSRSPMIPKKWFI